MYVYPYVLNMSYIMHLILGTNNSLYFTYLIIDIHVFDYLLIYFDFNYRDECKWQYSYCCYEMCMTIPSPLLPFLYLLRFGGEKRKSITHIYANAQVSLSFHLHHIDFIKFHFFLFSLIKTTLLCFEIFPSRNTFTYI